MKGMLVSQIGEFYNTAHLIRPIQTRVVQEYAKLMKNGQEFPSIQLGTYTGNGGKIIVDGAHTYRAAVLAKLEKHSVVVVEYPTLADALAAQLKANISHGVRLTPAQRDARIRELSEIYNWPVRKIAAAVDLHFSSVSRITRGQQNMSGKGKGGRRPGKQGQVVPHALPVPIFFRTVQNLHLTLSKKVTQTLILAAIHDPKRVAEMPKLVALLQQVATEFNDLLKQATDSIAEAEAEQASAAK